MTTDRAVLIIDDDRRILGLIERSFADEPFETVTVDNGAQAIQLLHERPFAVVLMDLRMPNVKGLDLLHEVMKAQPDTRVVLMTGFATVDLAREALEGGVSDFIAKPFLPNDLAPTIRRLCENDSATTEADSPTVGTSALVGQSAAFQTMVATARRAAASAALAMLVGESGVGKSVLAEFIHVLSGRRHRDFVVVNCAAIPAQLVESEMFGHARGAFSGAESQKPGFFEIAEGGTLFLDEIGELPMDLQPKLLHAVETGVFHRVGEPQVSRTANVRILSATNRPIEKDVAEGRFRKDLFYRLAVVPIEIPPLRDRKEDIPVLIDSFLETCSPNQPLRVSNEAMSRLLTYNWPGNIRELWNAIQHCTAGLEGSVLDVDVIPTWVGNVRIDDEPDYEESHSDPDADLSLRDSEIRLILRALRESDFNQTRAAKRLGVSRRTLHYRIQKHGLGDQIWTAAESSNLTGRLRSPLAEDPKPVRHAERSGGALDSSKIA
ncbi:MAG: sigma-54-dependent Fis family transcriptional regulator [bacterium]|nr:sigma-54-dependent Fis family transcriptional regulator [bacterium]